MFALGSLQAVVTLLLSLLAFAAEVFALVDGLRYRPEVYLAAGKRTKKFWTIVLGVAVVLGFVSIGGGGRIFSIGLIAFVAAAIYLADVRPALRSMVGRGGSGNQHMGPYGPW
ncbi:MULTISPECIES: DUF2516 family protein [unclassified Phycicoccus]|uniref:DUF2516 family protein n=1 Tax=unclassified Phycicoccus TaxID=2637926 RepID=UPI00070301CD|nr:MULTISPECIES: DUF2516 family protein [unclassified Phycicoccus]KQU67446.1 hypothetical protein ASC58_12820 [Phycicoccus sp. Root101]KQZ90127.1 hypothetical protein ASD62_13285 [Phycicoccus sp. Root563]